MILGADGRTISSQRKVGLVIEVLDRQPGSANAESARMAFELDSDDPAQISRLLESINRQIVKRLHDIGFLGTVQPASALSQGEQLESD